jgi:hypothetical protein
MTDAHYEPARFPLLRLALAAAAGLGCLALATLPDSPAGAERDFFFGASEGIGIGILLMVAVRLVPSLRERLVQDASNPALRRLAVRHRNEFFPPMLAYVGVMLCWRRLLDAAGPGWPRVLVALLPAVLIALVIHAMLRHARDSDELRRRIALESVAIAAALVGTGYMAAGFLQSAGLIALPADAAMLWVFPSLCAGYGVVKLFMARRYR